MHFIRKQVLNGDFLGGAWCNMSSAISTEIVANAGLDWMLIDQEHAAGDTMTLLGQLQSIGQKPIAPIVRVAWNDRIAIKRALDQGASGIMVPYVQSQEEAEQAVRLLRFPPDGERGGAMGTRAAGYGTNFDAYYAQANQNLLSVHQIETGVAVKNSADIAKVDGVDVLFIGPLDLSLNVGMPKKFDDPNYMELLKTVAKNANVAGKAAGILLPSIDLVERIYDIGYRFIAVGSDSGMIANGMRNNAKALAKFKI